MSRSLPVCHRVKGILSIEELQNMVNVCDRMPDGELYKALCPVKAIQAMLQKCHFQHKALCLYCPGKIPMWFLQNLKKEKFWRTSLFSSAWILCLFLFTPSGDRVPLGRLATMWPYKRSNPMALGLRRLCGDTLLPILQIRNRWQIPFKTYLLHNYPPPYGHLGRFSCKQFIHTLVAYQLSFI